MYKRYLYLTLYKKDVVFLRKQAPVHDYYATETLYYFFDHLNDLE
jgi:hypothetical protein